MSKLDSRFLNAVTIVLGHEGGYVHNPADPGGATNFGVSLRFALAELAKDCDGDGRLDGDFDMDGDVDVDDIRAMSVEDAADVYFRHWWDRYGYDAIHDDAIATKVFDLAVNMGPANAHRCLQRAMRACWFPLAEDGVLGPQTLSSVNAAEPRSLLAALKSEAAGYYRSLATAKPALGTFLKGWLNRAYS